MHPEDHPFVTMIPNNTLTSRQMDKSVLTIATGKRVYIDMAVGLARSFHVWNASNGIGFTIVTDRPELIPPDLSYVDVYEIAPRQYGTGFSTKLYIDKFAPAEKTLYIDADCLITAPLDRVFDLFEGHAVSVIGSYIKEGDWFGDIQGLCRRFNIDTLPLFVGAIYYVEKGPTCSRVFETARALEEQYDEIGLSRLRGVPNEEPLIALSMALHEQRPLPDDGTIKADAMNFPSGIEIDVFKGYAAFHNQTNRFRGTSGLITEARPVIAHFNDRFAEIDPYTHESARLQKVYGSGWPLWAAGAYAKVRHTFPQCAIHFLKDKFRPAYHQLVGIRKVKESTRIPG